MQYIIVTFNFCTQNHEKAEEWWKIFVKNYLIEDFVHSGWLLCSVGSPLVFQMSLSDTSGRSHNHRSVLESFYLQIMTTSAPGCWCLINIGLLPPTQGCVCFCVLERERRCVFPLCNHLCLVLVQAQLRAFIPEMLKYSTGRGKPGWGKESCKPGWWPEDIPWANVRSDVRTEEQKQRVREVAIMMMQYLVSPCREIMSFVFLFLCKPQ